MATAAMETMVHTHAEHVSDKAVDAFRRAAHLSGDVTHLKSLATDAVRDGLDAAKRTVQTATEWSEVKTEVAEACIKRNPFTAVGVAVAAGIPLGILLGWAYRTARARRTCAG